MPEDGKVNILLVDDQPAKILSYEVILKDLGENLVKVMSGREALEQLLKIDVAVILIDVNMPELDGFQLAAMIRQHPRFEQTAIIFVSAVHLTDFDRIRGYEMGAVDYVPVPVIPEVLRAKVRVFVDLYRKTRQLRELNDQLEQRVADRTTALEALTERQSILAREVDHRAKNALAIVQSIIRLTRGENLPEYRKLLEGRLAALSRAHALLSDARWQGASLRKLVEDESAPYRTNEGDRFTATGPDLMLPPATAQTLALALHELATNAAKYGALSAEGGKVNVVWQSSEGALQLNWIEQGGPLVSIPSKEGFGTMLISASIRDQLGGSTNFDWLPAGLHCSLEVPNADKSRSGDLLENSVQAQAPLAAASRSRVLLVEDELLIALMTKELLMSLGFSVVGPVTRVADAVAAAKKGEFESALLDINIRGESVFPVADVLKDCGIPFIFVTGYGSDHIEQRFADIPILQKPLQIDDLEEALRKSGCDPARSSGVGSSHNERQARL